MELPKMLHHDGPLYVLTGAAVGAAAAPHTWLQTANEVVQLIAGLVAIVAGVFAIVRYFHKERK